MKKPSSAVVKSFIRSRFVLEDDIGPFIPGTETARLSQNLMATFENIYCGVLPDKTMGMKFMVRSAKTGHCFAEVRVK
jgi:hypothetical protein